MPPKLDSELKTLRRHDTYYIVGADLSILVEHINFRVHRYFFERESNWFKQRLLTPASPGAKPQGSDDSNAIILEDITPDDFSKFLWVFYNPKFSLYDAPVEDWSTILTLSNRWSFPEVKALAVRELEQKPMLDVKRIKLYHETGVDRNVLIPRYAALIEREEPLTLEEGMDLGMETTLQIAKGREEARASRLPSGVRSPLTPTVTGADLHEVVRELFKIAPNASFEEEKQDVVPQPVNGFHTSGALKKLTLLSQPLSSPTKGQSTPPLVPPKTPTVRFQEQKATHPATPTTPKTPTTNANTKKDNKGKAPKTPQTPQTPKTAQALPQPTAVPPTTSQTPTSGQTLPPQLPEVENMAEGSTTTTVTTVEKRTASEVEKGAQSLAGVGSLAGGAVDQQQEKDGDDGEAKIQGDLLTNDDGNGAVVGQGTGASVLDRTEKEEEVGVVTSTEGQQQTAVGSTRDAAKDLRATPTTAEGQEGKPTPSPAFEFSFSLPDSAPGSPQDRSPLSFDKPKSIFADWSSNSWDVLKF